MIARLVRSVAFLPAGLSGFLAPTALWARDAEPTASGGGSWTMSYALVFLGVVLGLMVVLQPSRRRDRPQKDELED